MIGTRASRARSEQRLLTIWEPRIGRQATLTAREGVVWQVRAYLLAFVFFFVVLPLVTIQGSKTVLTVACEFAFATLLGFLIHGARLQRRASAQAAQALGVSHKNRHSVPVRRVNMFDVWAAKQSGLSTPASAARAPGGQS